jgi:hypothetical protein
MNKETHKYFFWGQLIETLSNEFPQKNDFSVLFEMMTVCDHNNAIFKKLHLQKI